MNELFDSMETEKEDVINNELYDKLLGLMKPKNEKNKVVKNKKRSSTRKKVKRTKSRRKTRTKRRQITILILEVNSFFETDFGPTVLLCSKLIILYFSKNSLLLIFSFNFMKQ